MRAQCFEHSFADAQAQIRRLMELKKASLQFLAYWTMNPSNVGPPVVESHNQGQSVAPCITLCYPATAAVCDCKNNCPRARRRCNNALLQRQRGVHQVINVPCPSSG